MHKYIIVTVKKWNLEQYIVSGFKKNKNFILINDPKKLTLKKLDSIKPKYIFFPHWSFKVNDKIINRYSCVCFHETNVPYGRGGSPIQNLILRNHKKTFITALKMTNVLDGGPVYIKRSLDLHGKAEEIYYRAAKIVFKMIKEIIKRNPKPLKQKGKIVRFKRRKPKQSNIPKNLDNLNNLYDFIRMLDADSYPKAFIKHGKFNIKFNNAKLSKKSINAMVNINIESKL